MKKLMTLTLLALAVAAPLHAVDTKTAPTTLALQTNAKPVPAPQLIERRPIKMQTGGALTGRLISKPQLADLINGGLIPFKPVVGRPAVKPGKNALLIIMENGGAMKNLDPNLTRGLNVNITTVTCAGLEFELPQGRSIADLIGDIIGQIGGASQCLNPGNWRQSTFNPLTWLNEQTDFALEAAITANNSLVNTQNKYDRVVILEDNDAVPDRVLASIRQLAPQYVIDVHVLTHGDSERFVGYQGVSFNANNFFNVLATEKQAGLPLYLRAVYQMNCRGGTLKDNWRALGAVTVNGTVGTNLNNMPHQYFHYLDKWLKGSGSSDAANDAFAEAAVYSRPIYTLAGQGALIDVSRLPAEGSNANANVNSGI